MVNPLQLPGQIAPLDITPSLTNLVSTVNQGQDDRRRAQTLSELGNLPLDEAAKRLMSSGDMSLAQLGVNLANTNYQHNRDVVSDQWRQQEASRAQKNADRSYGLQERAANRADEGPAEKAAQRVKVLQQNGIDPNSPEGKAYIISGEWAGPGAGGASLNPVYGVGPDGNPAMVQTTKTGQAIQTKLPDGFQISKDPIKVDLGTTIQLIDPQTRQPIGQPIPKDLAGVEREKVIGEETGKGQVALPQVLSTASQTLQAIENVRNHPGRGWGTGALGTIPGIPGTEQRGFIAALDQLKGKTFLEAFNSLRGGGAITEAEGAKATNAMARLDRAQNKQDFEAGLNDLRDVVKSGMLRAAAKARGGIGQQQPAPSAASDTSQPKAVTIDGYTITEH